MQTPKPIILDTSFLLFALKQKIDFYAELRRIIDTNFKLFIVDKQVPELEKRELGKLALKLLKHYKVSIIKTTSKKSVDDLILEQALAKDAYVATQDRKLKRKLKEHNIKTITVRQKSYLDFG